MTPEQRERRALAVRLAAQGIAIDTIHIPIFSNDDNETDTETLNMPAPTTKTPSPAQQKQIDAIAAAVGTAPNDIAATLAAVTSLLSPYAAADMAATHQLSARERAMVREMKVSPAAYLAQKQARKAVQR